LHCISSLGWRLQRQIAAAACSINRIDATIDVSDVRGIGDRIVVSHQTGRYVFEG
jgi:hypothetical protein